MKKIKLCLLGLISAFIFTAGVYAEEPFIFRFETEPIRSSGINEELFHNIYNRRQNLDSRENKVTPEIQPEILSTYSNVISYRDGYLGVDILSTDEHQGTRLTYYDKNGKVLNTKVLENYYIVSKVMADSGMWGFRTLRYFAEPIVVQGNNIYCTAINGNLLIKKDNNPSSATEVLKINENFEIVGNIRNVTLLNVVGNYVYVSGTRNIGIYDLNMNKIGVLDLYGENFESYEEQINYVIEQIGKIFPKIKWTLKYLLESEYGGAPADAISEEELYNLFSYLLDANEKYAVFANYRRLVSRTSYANLILMSKEGEIKELENVEIDFDTGAYSVKLVHDYLVVSDSIGCDKTRVRVFDMEGNLLEKFEKNTEGTKIEGPKGCFYDKRYGEIIETKNGFSVLRISEALIDVNDLNDGLFTPATTQYYNEVYTFPETEVEAAKRTITVKIKGKGNVVVIDTAKAGDLVNYLIDYQEGHQLKSLVVYDSKGNKIDVKDLAFTMVDDDVVIEAEFVPEYVENPETGLNKEILPIAFIVGISAIGYTFYRRKTINRI